MNEIPGGDLAQKALNDLNKKAAGATMKALRRALCTASEPLFRVGLGERYFTTEAGEGAAMLWALATVASYYVANHYGTIAGWMAGFIHLHWLADFLNQPVLAGLSGVAFIVFYFALCRRNAVTIQNLRNQGTVYHSMSRGLPRWSNDNVAGLIAILAILFLFNIFVLVVLGIAAYMAAKLADEQEQVIYSRFLDANDEKLENEYMKAALLGKADPGLTYLARPLSEKKYTPELRNNIADAFTGPATIIAQPPQSRKAMAADYPTPKTGGPSDSRPVTKAPKSDAATGSSASHIAAEEAGAPMPAEKPTVPQAPKMNPRIFTGLIIILAVGLTAGSIAHFWPAMPKEQADYFPAHTVASPTTQAKTVPNPSPPATPLAQSPPAPNKANVPPVATPVFVSKPATMPVVETKTAAAIAVTSTPPTAAATASQNNNQTDQSLKDRLAAAIDSLNSFSNYCMTTLAADRDRIDKLPASVQDRMSAAFQARTKATEWTINRERQDLEQLAASPENAASLEHTISRMTTARGWATNALMAFDQEISKATSQR
jgi:hypothetical protein